MIKFILAVALAAALSTCATLAPAQTVKPVPAPVWTVQAVLENAPGQRREAATPAAARTAAGAACAELGAERAASCLALLKARSFTTPTAAGPNWATWYLDVAPNDVGGRRSYVVIVAARP